MELLEQVHGDESQQAVLGSADGIALVAFEDSFAFLLVGSMTGEHCSPLSTDSLWGAAGIQGPFVGQAIGGRVPASPRVSHQQLPTAMLHPVETLHLRSKASI